MKFPIWALKNVDEFLNSSKIFKADEPKNVHQPPLILYSFLGACNGSTSSYHCFVQNLVVGHQMFDPISTKLNMKLGKAPDMSPEFHYGPAENLELCSTFREVKKVKNTLDSFNMVLEIGLEHNINVRRYIILPYFECLAIWLISHTIKTDRPGWLVHLIISDSSRTTNKLFGNSMLNYSPKNGEIQRIPILTLKRTVEWHILATQLGWFIWMCNGAFNDSNAQPSFTWKLFGKGVSTQLSHRLAQTIIFWYDWKAKICHKW